MVDIKKLEKRLHKKAFPKKKDKWVEIWMPHQTKEDKEKAEAEFREREDTRYGYD
jgi:hypothetical protein